jgi:hypothetical protein
LLSRAQSILFCLRRIARLLILFLLLLFDVALSARSIASTVRMIGARFDFAIRAVATAVFRIGLR